MCLISASALPPSFVLAATLPISRTNRAITRQAARLHSSLEMPEHVRVRAQDSLSCRRILTLWPHSCEKKSHSDSDRNLSESMKGDLPWGIRARYEQHNR